MTFVHWAYKKYLTHGKCSRCAEFYPKELIFCPIHGMIRLRKHVRPRNPPAQRMREERVTRY